MISVARVHLMSKDRLSTHHKVWNRKVVGSKLNIVVEPRVKDEGVIVGWKVWKQIVPHTILTRPYRALFPDFPADELVALRYVSNSPGPAR